MIKMIKIMIKMIKIIIKMIKIIKMMINLRKISKRELIYSEIKKIILVSLKKAHLNLKNRIHLFKKVK
jgi:hypothetical protein